MTGLSAFPVPAVFIIFFCFLKSFLFLFDALFHFLVKVPLVLIGQIFSRDVILRVRMFGYIGEQFFSVDSQPFGSVKRGFQIIILFKHLLGIYDHIVDQLTVRQDSAAAVHDLSPFTGKSLVIVSLLGKYLHGIRAAIVPLNEIKTDPQRKKSCQDDQKQDHQPFFHTDRKTFWSFPYAASRPLNLITVQSFLPL